MKAFFSISVLLFSVAAFGSEVICEGWYQDVGGELKKTTLAMITSNEKDVVWSGSYNGFSYNVDWNKELTTFYIRIEQGSAYILGTTARVPTDNHPENFTDLHLPNGPRLSVNCEMK